MGCRQTREAGYAEPDGAAPAAGAAAPSAPKAGLGAGSVGGVAKLPRPQDDVITWVANCGGGRLAACGIDGQVYTYDVARRALLSSFSAHRKAVNKMRFLCGNVMLTASNDATVRLWRLAKHGAPADGAVVEEFEGHKMSVSALDVLGWPEAEGALPSTLFTGSRDCTVRLWDLETAKELHQNKILRNVVTAVRTLPENASVVAQASEDLQLRLWDARAAPQPVHAVRGGPNQLICMDVTPDGRYVACGSKGFSRENCEVKVFDVRAGLKQLSAAPCADQTIEALRVVGADRCLIAGKDGCIRTVALPEVRVLHERGPAAAGYTALGVAPWQGGLVALAALTGPGGPSLELLAWSDETAEKRPTVLAISADDD